MVMKASLLLSLLLEEVHSFQFSNSSPLRNIVSSLPGNLQPQQSRYSPLFAFPDDDSTFATATEFIGDKMFAELDKMRQQFSELTESLTMAKEREDQAVRDVTTLAEKKGNVEVEKESFFAERKRVLRYVCFTFTQLHYFVNLISLLT